jgi:hypothetical protein
MIDKKLQDHMSKSHGLKLSNDEIDILSNIVIEKLQKELDNKFYSFLSLDDVVQVAKIIDNYVLMLDRKLIQRRWFRQAVTQLIIRKSQKVSNLVVVDVKEPCKEVYGWYPIKYSEGSTQWLLEGGEEAYNRALEKWKKKFSI